MTRTGEINRRIKAGVSEAVAGGSLHKALSAAREREAHLSARPSAAHPAPCRATTDRTRKERS